MEESTPFLESGCKGTAFFLIDQIFLQKKCDFGRFLPFLAENRGKIDDLLEWIALERAKMAIFGAVGVEAKVGW